MVDCISLASTPLSKCLRKVRLSPFGHAIPMTAPVTTIDQNLTSLIENTVRIPANRKRMRTSSTILEVDVPLRTTMRMNSGGDDSRAFLLIWERWPNGIIMGEATAVSIGLTSSCEIELWSPFDFVNSAFSRFINDQFPERRTSLELGNDIACENEIQEAERMHLKQICSRHKRSKSLHDEIHGVGSYSPFHAFSQPKLDAQDINGTPNIKKKESSIKHTHSSLKKEILQLQRHLQGQVAARRALEKALGYRSSSSYMPADNSMPKPAKELIKEIAVLELEVVHLEQYLLFLYRRAFDEHVLVSSPSASDMRSASSLEGVAKPESTSETPSRAVHASRLPFPKASMYTKKETGYTGKSDLVACMPMRHSSLSRSSVCPRTSLPRKNLDQTLRSYQSQPLSLLQHSQNSTANLISLAEHLGARISDHVPETPNRLSEELIRCMASIYCKLANPPLAHHCNSSPSSLSSTSPYSLQNGDIWSPHSTKESSLEPQVGSSFQVEYLREFSGPYSSMLEVHGICRGSQRPNDVENLLQNFKSLVQRLENVDPRKLKHEEKIAFWINMHNALVMHGYLAHGIPKNSIQRGIRLLKVAYNVGGHTVSADTIQSSILGCHIDCPGLWLWTLFSARTKLKRDNRHSYAIDPPEPLIHFALSTGSHSDPPVRVYTAKKVFQELDGAKEDYIKATVNVSKEQRILLPKIIESFAKASSLSCTEVIEMVHHYLPERLKKSMQRNQKVKPIKSVEWVPHDYNFRYLLSKELVK